MLSFLESIKRIGWFVFKSPQRSWVGWQTLLTDIEGLLHVFISYFKSPEKEIIWVCVGNKNRSSFLLQHLVTSMSLCSNADQLGLSVADCGSTDIGQLESEIRKIWSGPLVFSQQNEDFQRAAVFNRAIRQAKGELVFVCDADVTLPISLVNSIRKYVTDGSAWFPVCQWQLSLESTTWKWFSAGTGIFAATKKQLSKVGYYDETFKGWGKEDWDLFFRFYQNKIMPLRTRCRNLYHHWHPTSKPIDFKNVF